MLLACVLVALVSVPPGAPVGGLVSGAGHARQRSTHFVEKTHFSKSNRAVFVAGLEGTGHHAIGPMITAINKAIGSRPLAHVQVLPEAVQAVLYRRGEQPHGAFLLAQDQSVQTLKMIEADRELLKDNFKYLSSRESGNIALLNTGPYTSELDRWGVGRMSYPNYGGPDKALHTPDVRVLAELAEQAGLDLRILVLMRRADEILRSTVFHRHFGPEARQASILGASAALLASQLQLIDRRFFVCVNSTRLTDPAEWEGGTRTATTETPVSIEGTNDYASPDVAGGPSSLRDLWNIDVETARKAANMMGTWSVMAHTPHDQEEQLSSVALAHLAAMNDVLMSVCGMPLS